MMALSTFAELQASIKDWLARPAITDAVVNDFIRLGEQQMFNELRVREMICVAQADLNEEYEWLPSGWLEHKHVNILELDDAPLETATISNTYHLPYADNREFVRYDYSGSKPRLYTIVGDRIRFITYPVVASGENSKLAFELVFYGSWTPLSATDTTNTILTNLPQLYLFASLIQAEAYLVGDPRIQTWMGLYQKNLNSANQTSLQSEYGTMAIGMAY
jgi:hypothetical protein